MAECTERKITGDDEVSQLAQRRDDDEDECVEGHAEEDEMGRVSRQSHVGQEGRVVCSVFQLHI